MTSHITLHCNGNYVLEARRHPTSEHELVSVGPGSNVQKQIPIPHGGEVIVFDFTEREATEEEIEAAKSGAEVKQE